MSVDYYSCAICDHNFPDCGDYYYCDECGNHFCSRDCAKLELLDEDDEGNETNNCCICRKEEANDYILLEALLTHYNLTREDALKIWQEEKDTEEDDDEHDWDMGWVDTGRPHPGFGGTTDITGHYVGQCRKCGMYDHEFTDQPCGEKIRDIEDGK